MNRIVTSTYRGHAIRWVAEPHQHWVYELDNMPIKLDPARPCGKCGIPDTPEGHDGCLGNLPGVINACCGHGEDDSAYVMLPDRSCIRGQEAIVEIERLKRVRL